MQGLTQPAPSLGTPAARKGEGEIMGCDIHIVAQKRNDAGEWKDVHGDFIEGPDPFDWRQYGMFAFLSGVRNYSDISPISEPRGLPDDFELHEYENAGDGSAWLGDHSFSWLSVGELLAVDYDQVIEDRRVTRKVAPNLWSGSQTCDVDAGERVSLRDFLGEGYFNDLNRLKEIGAERIVFGFDN